MILYNGLILFWYESIRVVGCVSINMFFPSVSNTLSCIDILVLSNDVDEKELYLLWCAMNKCLLGFR